MAEGAVGPSNHRGWVPKLSLPVSGEDDIFKRRIEFHPARRPFSGFALSCGDFHIETLNPSSNAQPTVTGGGATSSAVAADRRPDGGEVQLCGLDPELSFDITFRRIGAGLANLGNTCFLNSVLQCLTYTEPFAAYLQSGKHRSSCRAAGFCAMCALQSHVMDALQSTGKILRPFHLVKNLRCISRNFRNSRQEDAHEYMVNLLESMHKCCLPSGIASESPSAYEKSLVHKIFGGHLRSQVKCLQCSHCSNKFDPFLDLSLEIIKADTLRKALSHFSSEEKLDGGEREYHCQQCRQKVRAVKQLTVHKAPYVLTIHLKRFGSGIPGQKIDKRVDFEPTLDLKPYVSNSSEGDLTYTLYGVLVHAGYGTHSGHYFCFVQTSSGMWHSLNDHQVCQVSEKTVLQQKAYMLFYVRNVRNSAPRRKKDVSVAFNLKESIKYSAKSEVSAALDTSTAISKTNATSLCEFMHLRGASVTNLLLNQVPVVPTNGVNSKVQQCNPMEDNTSHSSSGISSVKKISKSDSSLQKYMVHTASSEDMGNKDGLQRAEMEEKDGTLGPEFRSRSDLPSRLTLAGIRIDVVNKQDPSNQMTVIPGKSGSEKADLIAPSDEKFQSRNSESQALVIKRSEKCCYERSILFGPRRLFLVTLNLQRRKKRRMKRRHSTCIKTAGISESNGQEDEEASTSSKMFHANDNYCGNMKNASGIQNVLSTRISCRPWNDGPRTSLLSQLGQHGTLETFNFNTSKNHSQRGTSNASKKSFWEVPVPQWEDIELPPEIEIEEDKPIGYILDEWDKELDRGKRKKVKSKRRFGGENPFQDFANEQAQRKKKKVDWTSSQPRRV